MHYLNIAIKNEGDAHLLRKHLLPGLKDAQATISEVLGKDVGFVELMPDAATIRDEWRAGPHKNNAAYFAEMLAQRLKELADQIPAMKIEAYRAGVHAARKEADEAKQQDLKSLRADAQLLDSQFHDLFAAFTGAYDTPIHRRHQDVYEKDACHRFKEFKDTFKGVLKKRGLA